MAISASLNVQWRTNSRRSVGGSNSAAIWASVSCCRRISRSPRRLRPADQPIRARESMSVLRRRPKMRQTVAFMAPPLTRSWTRYPGRISAAPAPARSRFVRLCYKNWPFVSFGQTPVLDPSEARALLDSIDVSTHAGLRDRALLGLMVYSFARIGAALGMAVEDVYTQNRRL